MRRFAPGDEVVLRYITRIDAVPGMTWPCRVVRDDEELLVLYVPRETIGMTWRRLPGAARELVETPWRRDMLRLMFPGLPYSVWLFWEGEDRAFTGYYVNFEEPFRRTPIGFDTNDHALDIVVAPDFRWMWKDRDEFEALVADGEHSGPFGESVREAAPTSWPSSRPPARPSPATGPRGAPPKRGSHPCFTLAGGRSRLWPGSSASGPT